MPDLKTFEEQKALIGQLNLMDDLFFHKVAEDTQACEEILRIILKKPDLQVKRCQPQRFLRNIDAHSVILDVLCTDESGRMFNIEVQKQDNDDHQRRVRFNISNIDTFFMEKGVSYADFPDVCVVYISAFDIFKLNQPMYHVYRVVKGTEKFVENGTHEVYVNAAINDGSTIAELMQYFMHSSGYHENFRAVCKRVNYLKEQNEGVSSMSSVIEQYAQQYHEEKMRNNSVIEQYAQRYHEEKMQEPEVIERYAKEYAQRYYEEKMRNNSVIEQYAQRYHEEKVKEDDKEKAIKLLKRGISAEIIAEAMPSLSEEEILKLKDSLAVQTAI